ncbi:type IV secretory system conjugative DNA transfer family protein [Bradyrhizobium elkanii]|uniref:type IV secretory system conjugative DNA transfer family protein n=1 Tax=Bradyrhizobium elkanii TaxID=29448 RepID=UPI001BA99181|nr:type IV secretory system conjugative DNA transfer family protein [Bradyrhizobium elkanii]
MGAVHPLSRCGLRAAVRADKGHSVVIPNLLDYPGFIIVIDVKGENHAVAVPARARALPRPGL